jgi:hypothetical protein
MPGALAEHPVRSAICGTAQPHHDNATVCARITQSLGACRAPFVIIHGGTGSDHIGHNGQRPPRHHDDFSIDARGRLTG